MNLSSILKPIEVLSLDAKQQIRYIEKLGTLPSIDELALEFNDLFLQLKSQKENHIFLKDLSIIDEKLDRIEKRNISDLTDPKRNEIRMLSKNFLQSYREKIDF